MHIKQLFSSVLIFSILLTAFAHESMQDFASTEQDIGQAFCKPQMPSEKEMDDAITGYMQTFHGNSYMPVKIHGGKSDLKLPAPMAQALSEMLGQVPSEKINKLQSCNSLNCVLELAFESKAQGLRYLWAKLKYGINLSNYAERADADEGKSTGMPKADEDTVLTSLLMLPNYLLNPNNANYQVIKYQEKGDTENTYAITYTTFAGNSGSGRLLLYPALNRREPLEQQYLATHELSHIIAQTQIIEDDHPNKFMRKRAIISLSPDYAKALGMVANPPGSMNFEQPEGFKWPPLSRLSQTGDPSQEFIAEAIAAYRYNPAHLKGVAPKIYDFLKQRLFNGLEFTSEEACQGYFSASISAKPPIQYPHMVKPEVVELQPPTPVVQKPAQPQKMEPAAPAAQPIISVPTQTATAPVTSQQDQSTINLSSVSSSPTISPIVTVEEESSSSTHKISRPVDLLMSNGDKIRLEPGSTLTIVKDLEDMKAYKVKAYDSKGRELPARYIIAKTDFQAATEMGVVVDQLNSIQNFLSDDNLLEGPGHELCRIQGVDEHDKLYQKSLQYNDLRKEGYTMYPIKKLALITEGDKPVSKAQIEMKKCRVFLGTQNAKAKSGFNDYLSLNSQGELKIKSQKDFSTQQNQKLIGVLASGLALDQTESNRDNEVIAAGNIVIAKDQKQIPYALKLKGPKSLKQIKAELKKHGLVQGILFPADSEDIHYKADSEAAGSALPWGQSKQGLCIGYDD